MINTILVEDDRFIQEYFSNMLAADDEFYLIAAVRDALEAEKLCGGNISVFAEALCSSGLTAEEIEELRRLLERGEL